MVIGSEPYFEPETVEEMSHLIRDAKRILLRRNDTYSPAFRLPGPVGLYGKEKLEFWEADFADFDAYLARAKEIFGGIAEVDPVAVREQFEAERKEFLSRPKGQPGSWSISSEWAINDDELREKLDDEGCTHIPSEMLREIVEFDPDDQVVKVQADLCIGNLCSELEKKGQTLPLPRFEGTGLPWSIGIDSVGTLVSMNLPHGLEAQCGSWRDWVLGMTVVMADGTIVKCGSKAVKNVAGYDVQKLFVGARDTLGIIVDVTLKTYPLKAVPPPSLETRMTPYEIAKRQGEMGISGWWIQRLLPSDWSLAVRAAGEYLVVADHASNTIYALVPEPEELPRYPGDWLIRSGCGEKNLQITDPVMIKYMKRAKEIFDPTNKLNPGEMGIF